MARTGHRILQNAMSSKEYPLKAFGCGTNDYIKWLYQTRLLTGSIFLRMRPATVAPVEDWNKTALIIQQKTALLIPVYTARYKSQLIYLAVYYIQKFI